MTDDQKARLRILLLRQRESHQKIFDLQGAMIDALREALAAVSRTQDEMARVFATDEETHDALEEQGAAATRPSRADCFTQATP